ncbi:phospholipase B1, membrane-associated-like isoform X2 [Schistocerca cancellata]|uniref:phospholipase B1, membrane-associated-like isoform X2 n=1 Tax=Schistocerca cancellata TaxID=274614 RepID=UPI0021190CDF|nr:phospholipase B1, membrane-associated-like isoform X2 [Schistocerca cancellata]
MRTLSLVAAAAYCFLSLPAGPGQVLSYAGQIAFQADPPSLIAFYESVKNVLSRTLRPKDRAKFLETLRQQKALQPEVPSDRPFPCDPRLGRSPSPPDSVHRLRPGDIDVVAALGDSLTAGNGILAANIMQVLAENRGVSWSIGGEGDWRQFLTLPNILKEFNPRLVGFSLNDSSGHEKASQFNVAEIYAMSRDLPWQAQLLVRRMRAHPDVDVQRHWKLVTILIGANDFCNELCVGDTARHAVEDHRRDLVAALDCLREQLPRTLVNIVVVPNLELLRNFTGRTSECAALVTLLCPCIFQSRERHRLPEFVEVMRRWQQVEIDVLRTPFGTTCWSRWATKLLIGRSPSRDSCAHPKSGRTFTPAATAICDHTSLSRCLLIQVIKTGMKEWCHTSLASYANVFHMWFKQLSA